MDGGVAGEGEGRSRMYEMPRCFPGHPLSRAQASVMAQFTGLSSRDLALIPHIAITQTGPAWRKYPFAIWGPDFRQDDGL